MAEMDFSPPAELGRIGTIALGVGVIALVLLLVAAFATDGPAVFFRAYLVGYIFWIGPAVGCLGMLMLQHVITGSWGLVVRRVLEAATRTLPLMAVAFIPIIAGMGVLYSWTHPEPGDFIVQRKLGYLNQPFFVVRAVIIFGVWILLATLLNKYSADQDATGDVKPLRKANKLSGPGIVVYVFMVTFAAVDWVMSLDPHWFSTIFGLLYLINWLITCWTLVIATMYWLAQRAPMNHVMNPRHFHDIGKLILAFVMVWAYFSLSQFLITWAGNLPEETRWYIRRWEGNWGKLMLGIVILHFALPFLLLLSRDLKRNAGKMLGVVALVFVMRLYDAFWIIWPELSRPHGSHAGHGAGPSFHGWWTVILAFLGLGGIWLWYFTVQLRKRPLMPPRDPKLAEALAVSGHGH